MQRFPSAVSGRRAARSREQAGVAERHRVYLVATLALAFLVRFAPLSAATFPLNDGGLFAAMIEDLRANSYVAPAFTSYNGGEIPFAYPPLGFYLGALLSELPGVDTLAALQIIPLVASTLTVAAVYPLALRLLRDQRTALLAVLAFALLPRAYNWELMGGGVTRGVGLLFAVLALSALYDVYARNQRRAAPLAGLLLALAWLSHLEMGWYALYGAAVMLAFHREDLSAKLRSSIVIGAIVAALTAPWWGLVLARHGLDPFLAALQAGEWSPLTLGRLLLFDFSETPLLDVFSVLGLLGIFLALRERRLLLPVWLVAIFLLDPRKAPTLAMLPLAMLAAEAVSGIVPPALRSAEPPRPPSARALARWSLPGVFIGLLVAYGAMSALAAGAVRPSLVWAATTPLSEADRAAMQWAAGETPEDSAFVIVSDALIWGEDAVSEWFPVLAGRVSLATPQGTEWTSGDEFQGAIAAYEELQLCRSAGTECLAAWADAHAPFAYVYVSSRPAGNPDGVSGRLATCCDVLRRALLASPEYELAHDGGEVQVSERVRR